MGHQAQTKGKAMTELLTYSSNENSKLNDARRSLWSSKYMLGEANKAPEKYCKSFYMTKIKEDRAALQKIAREIRAKLPAQDVYRVQLQGEITEFAEYIHAHSQQQANRRVQDKYGDHFRVVHHA